MTDAERLEIIQLLEWIIREVNLETVVEIDGYPLVSRAIH